MNSTVNTENMIAAGQRLRDAREQSGLSLQAVASELHMQVRMLQAMEAGEWSRLGAPVFVRGQIRSYAKRLGLDPEPMLAAAELGPVQPMPLVSREHVSGWERFFNDLGMKTVYVVMTLGLAIPVYMALTRPPVPAGGLAEGVAAPGTPRVAPQREPVSASMASLPKAAEPVAAPVLTFDFQGESWVQFYSPDGSTLEKGLMKPGDRRQFASGELGRAVLGNASEVQVSHAGRPLDMSPWLRSNVARFTVSSDGSPARPER